VLLPEHRPLGDPVASDPTPPCDTYPKAWEHEGGPGYSRHRDYPGIRHGGTDGLIRAEHSNLEL